MITLTDEVDSGWWSSHFRTTTPQTAPLTGDVSVNRLALGYLDSDLYCGQASFDVDLRTYLGEHGITLSEDRFELVAAHAFQIAYGDRMPLRDR